MWSVEFVAAAVEERAALPADLRARLSRMAEFIADHGLDALPRDWSRPLESKLWELRLRGKDGIARAIYVTRREKRLIIVRIFVKKTQKTPLREIEIARARAKQIE
jgi:phage-related protein